MYILWNYRTAANIAVKVRTVVNEIPIRASTMFDGIRKQSQVMKISRTEGK